MQIGGMLSRSVLLVGLVLACQSAPQEASARTTCTYDYRPVCAVNRLGVRSTYPNECSARGTRVLHRGECLGAVCFFIYSPVCAIDPVGLRSPRTYSNLCAAENANARLLRNGSCELARPNRPSSRFYSGREPGPGGSDVPFPSPFPFSFFR